MKKGFALGKKLNLLMIVVGILVISVVGTRAATAINSSMVSYNDTTVKETLDKLLDNVQGKKLIAEAITEKGIETSETDSYEVMANNIKNMETSKITYLGTEASFNLTSYSNYANFTKDNFLVVVDSTSKSWTSNASATNGYSTTAMSGRTTTTISINKTYDANTGILNVNAYVYALPALYVYNNSGGWSWGGGTTTSSPIPYTVYLVE